jgi:hypothetical protein
MSVTSDKDMAMPIAPLADRSVIHVGGPDARKFLHNLITCNVAGLETGGARFGALLMPQGKIIADFFLYAPAGEPEAFLLDVPRALKDDLLKRLNMYLLRAKVEFTLDEELAVAARFGADAPAAPASAQAFADPRLAAMGERLVLPRAEAEALAGDACYVGQEVVSRMQHRGTARTRSVQAVFEFAPEEGSEIRAGEKTVGHIGSSAQGQGIALVRLDRAADASAAGLPLVAGGVEITLRRPDWATFAMGDA